MENPIFLKSQSGSHEAIVDLNGGMLAQLYVKPKEDSTGESSKKIAIFHQAPWLKENYYQDKAGLMEHLSGEWACVPFGFVTQDSSLFLANAPHGLPCHSAWTVKELSEDKSKLTICYDYPSDNDLKHIERTIELSEDKVYLSFTIVSKKDCSAPMGVHPVFPTKGMENELELEIAGDGMVYGIECEPNVSRLVTGAYFDSLSAVPLKEQYHNLDGNSTVMDGTHLPKPYDTEEIIQMLHPNGEAILKYKNKGLKVTLSWDKELIPTCLLWISNYGRKFAPWNGENCCLGIEPIAGAWDLAQQSVNNDNAIVKEGVPTTVSLKAGSPITFNYQLAIESL